MKLFQSKKSPEPRRRQRAEQAIVQQEKQQSAFRRNRTLTGSTSGQITSPNEANAALLSPRAHVHHLNQLRRRLLFYSIMVLAAILGVLFLLSQLVSSVQVAGNGVVLPSDIKSAYEKRIDSYLGSRPIERLRFLLNESQLVGYIQEKHPEVTAVTTEPSGKLGEMSVGVSLRRPTARWAMNGENMFVDKNGIVFGYNAFSPPSISIVDNSGVPTAGIESVASSSFLAFVGRVVGDASERGYTVKSATIPAFSIRELDIRLKGVPYRFKMTTDRPAGEQVEDMARITQYIRRHHMSLTYVDVRIKGKAYYR